MKTRKQTKTRNQAQKVKEMIKTVLFFSVPVVLIVCAILMSGNNFNAF